MAYLYQILASGNRFKFALLLLLLCLVATNSSFAQENNANRPPIFNKDSIISSQVPIDTSVVDSLIGDSIVNNDPKQRIIDSLKLASDIKSQVKYNATDSIVFDMAEDMLYLYGAVSIEYGDITLKAAKVRIEWENEMMYAEGTKDKLGNLVETPVFTQAGQEYKAREMSYNFKTQKGRIKGGRMVQQDGFVLSEVAKRYPDGTLNAAGGKFTTCDLDHPHFYIQAKKIKMLPKNQIVTGPFNFVIADFPLPVFVPFGFIPKMDSERRRKGIIMPQYGDAAERGFFLRGLGYYTPLGNNFDLLIDGDFYTRGGWRLGARSNYKKRYSFNGSFGFEYSLQQFGEKEDPDASRTTAWRLTWNHSQPINPKTRLSANVNISSSNTIRQLSFNQRDFFTNNVRSSVSFQKTFGNSPFNMAMTVSHSQDLNKSTMSMDLPTLNVNMARQQPFRKLVSGKKGLDFLSNLGVTWRMAGSQRLNSVPDTLFIPVLFRLRDTVDVLDTDSSINQVPTNNYYTAGANQNISASTSIKLFKYINIAPSYNYRGYLNFNRINRSINEEGVLEEKEETGLYYLNDYNMSASASTNFFGIYQFRSKRQFAIRQRITPSVSYNFRPDFGADRFGYYDSYVDTTGREIIYDRYQTGFNRSPSRGEQQAISFSLTNVFEMKYKKKNADDPDFDEKDKFVYGRLIDNLGISSSYNFAADSFRLSNPRLSARTQLFNRQLNVNASATLDPYVFDSEQGRRIDQLVFSDGSLGRISAAQISFNTSIRSEAVRSKEKSEEFDENEFQEIQRNLQDYVDFDVPWNVSMSYNLSYNKRTPDVEATVTQTFRMNGDMNFTPKWKIGFSSGYDFRLNKITQTNISIFRDLHCWQMNFTWVPFGTLQSYVLTINVKSPTLSSLRLSKRDQWQDRRQFF